MDTVISVKIDTKTKGEAQKIAESLGISLSTLVKAYLRQVVATRRIEFYAPEPMTPRLEVLLGQIEKEVEQGKVSKKFKSAKALIADLHQ